MNTPLKPSSRSILKSVLKRKKVRVLLALSGALVFIYSTHFLTSQSTSLQTSNNQEGSKSLSLSTASSKKGRKLILNKITKSKTNKNKKEISVLMSDPAMSQKWGLKKTDTRKAWKISQGSKDIVVAIIDTGIDIHHKDIKNNLWRNPGESGFDKNGKDKATNGIDDDGNGCKDDVFGCDFITNTGNLTDNHGHGTHIAGIVGAEGGNGFGISGVAPKVQLMVLKYFDPKSSGVDNLKNTIRAIRYAVDKGAHIINYSGGGLEFSQDEYRAVAYANKKGVLFVAAAGNERSNSDHAKYYPANYNLENIISVTAINPDTKVLRSSNYGIQTVDIAAPGENIFSTLPGGGFGLMTGTSQATAFATGVATLVMANNREFTAAQVKKYILKTGDNIETLKGKTGTSKKLNSYKALVTLDQGVSAMGAIAKNTLNLKAEQFASDPNIRKSKRSRNIALFGKDLLQAIKKVKGQK